MKCKQQAIEVSMRGSIEELGSDRRVNREPLMSKEQAIEVSMDGSSEQLGSDRRANRER